MKKGQIALFVIIAILIVSAVGFIVYTQRGALGIKLAPEQAETRSITSFIESCITSTGENALFVTGKQGGYYIPPQYAAGSIAYYFYDNKSYMPSKSEIENQLSIYLVENLESCTGNFSMFPDFSIETGKINSTAKILSNKVSFSVSWHLVLRKGYVYQLNSFNIEIPSRLSAIYATAEKITAQQLQSSQICLSCIIDYADENKVYVSMESIGGNTMLFTIKDNQTLISNQPYEFTFANKY